MATEQTILSEIQEKMTALPRHLGFYYKNLKTGFEYGINEEDAFLAASVIKFPLLLHVLARAARGEISLSDKLVVENWEKMPSCGGLNQFTDAVTADIRTLCRLMIVLSDNTATNKLIRRCTIPGANAGFRQMGLKQTVLRRLLFDREASAAGLENTVSPKEMGMLLEQVYRAQKIIAGERYHK